MTFNYEQSIWGRGEASLRWKDPTAVRLKESLRSLGPLATGAKVLEVGTGAGQFIRAIKRLRSELDCFGCDISSEAIRIARAKNDGVAYEVSQDYHFPYADNSMDAVVIFDVLEHVADPKKLLAEVNRVLKTSGIFYAFVPCENDVSSLWHLLNFLHLKRNLTQKYAGHIQFFKRKELLKLFQEVNFTITRLRYSEHFVGQCLGVLAFLLMHRASQRLSGQQINNEAYFTRANGNTFISAIKNFVNRIVYLESSILSFLPSPNVHVTVFKK